MVEKLWKAMQFDLFFWWRTLEGTSGVLIFDLVQILKYMKKWNKRQKRNVFPCLARPDDHSTTSMVAAKWKKMVILRHFTFPRFQLFFLLPHNGSWSPSASMVWESEGKWQLRLAPHNLVPELAFWDGTILRWYNSEMVQFWDGIILRWYNMSTLSR